MNEVPLMRFSLAWDKIRCLLAAAAALCLLFGHSVLWADGLADNHPESVRRLPKLGIDVPADKRAAIETAVGRLGKSIDDLKTRAKDERIRALLPDVQIYWQAVRDALDYQEFFTEKEPDVALELLAEGEQRAEQLAKGNPLWTKATGLVVRGYLSKIDGSVQPYGLVIPESYVPLGTDKIRLDVWFHGRGETLSQVNFLAQRRSQPGTFAPPNAIVLHPYGRYNNAAKFAGEIDALEALDSVKRQYRIDDDRITVRGFSMGGASAWHFAAHYPGLWAAANPGAGFSETPEFLKFFQKEDLHPTWWEKKLWHLYDSPNWSRNFFHCPTVAYSGELDIQKQAADVMEPALKRENIELVHIIGPGTKHSYHPAARDEVERLVSKLAERGRDPLPLSVHFTTYTLRYNQLAWLTVDALDEHWKQANVDGNIHTNGRIELEVDNVAALTINIPPGRWPFRGFAAPRVLVSDASRPSAAAMEISGSLPALRSDLSWSVSLHREGDHWSAGPSPSKTLLKKHGLQGPIDDAFMDAFVFVRPTGNGRNPQVDSWARGELDRAIEQWRRHFRGHARVKDDREVTDDDIAGMNLVLWGDPSSNSLFARLADRLPIKYEGEALTVGDQKFPAAHHAPILIYPNPLNPSRYVVINSSFTFREYAHLNNARQVPMLPDWAIVDLRTPPDTVWPGKIAAAGFFGERWELKPDTGK